MNHRKKHLLHTLILAITACPITSCEIYAQLSLKRIHLRAVEANGSPLRGNFSVSVSDGSVVPFDSTQMDIKSDMGLNSELSNGNKKYHTHLLSNSRTTRQELDNLLIMSKPQYYDINKILNQELPQIQYNIEETQVVQGAVCNVFGNAAKNVLLTTFEPHTLKHYKYELGDSSRFTLSDLDIQHGNTIILEAIRKSGAKNGLRLKIDSITFSPILLSEKVTKYLPTQERTITYDSAFKQLAVRDKTHVMSANPDKFIELPDIEIKGRDKRYRNRKGSAARALLSGDEKIERAPDMASILRSLGIMVRYDSTGKPFFGKQVASLLSEGFAFTPTYVDDALTDQEDIWDINTPNIEQIEYLTPNDPSNIIYGNDAVAAGCLLIYLKSGYKKEKKRELGSNVAVIQNTGYQPSVEFYAPWQTTDVKQLEQNMGMRTTLYWNPNVSLDKKGEAWVEFVAPASLNNFIVTVEGISENGLFISKHTLLEK